MPTATLTSRGQITLPKIVRERLGVGAGDNVEFVETAPGIFRVSAEMRDVGPYRCGFVPRRYLASMDSSADAAAAPLRPSSRAWNWPQNG